MYALRTGLARYAPRSEPCGKLLKVGLQALPVVVPRLSIDARGSLSLDAEIGCAQPLNVVDVVQERSEPLFPFPSCCLTYPLERA